jgi:D-alanine-D-alanine ligase-like ATP-grasp enzyme
MNRIATFLQNHRFVPSGSNGGLWLDATGTEMIHLYSFEGPNLLRLDACGGIVMARDCSLNVRIGPAEIERIQALLKRLGYKQIADTKTSDHLGDWLVDLLLQVQQHLFFPVQWRKFTQRADGVTELAFELGRSAWASRLLVHALALLESALRGSADHPLDEPLNTLHRDLRSRLSHLYRQDRHKTAARLGIYRPTVSLLGTGWTYLGQGAKACLIAGGTTSRTSAMGKELAGDKHLALARLRLNGLPVARQAIASSADEAVSAAKQLGYPVVVKPLRGRQSKGVSVNLQSDDAVRTAFGRAQSRHEQAVVETYHAGLDYRLLVIGGRFVAAVRRDVRTLQADGIRSVRELVEQTNATTRGTDLFFSAITLDEDAIANLAAQGYGPDSVPGAGRKLYLRQMASPESTATDVTDLVHPDNRALAVSAAQACLLDVAGIDLVSADIGDSWRTNGARIVEVNSGPAADLHMFPQYGLARDVSWHLIRSCLPAARPGRIPVVLYLSENLHSAFLSPVTSVMTKMGYRVGQYPVNSAQTADLAATDIAALLTNPELDAAVICWSLSQAAREGFPVDRVRVAVIADPLPDRLEAQGCGWGQDEIQRLCRLACDLATDSVVIDGTHPLLREAVSHRPAAQIGYLWPEDAQTDGLPLQQHLEAGGWAITSADVQASGNQSEGPWPALAVAHAVALRLAAPSSAQKPGSSLGSRVKSKKPAQTWTPDALTQLFCGAWVNGPDQGWQVNRIVTRLSAVSPGDLFVCMSPPDDLSRIAAVDTEIWQAFAQGARAVVATQVPLDLPRWRPVLVCDDPAAGIRATEHA